MPEFAQHYPEIEFDLDFNDRFVDLVEGGFDVAIRSGPLSDSSLMARRLGPFRFVLAAALAYLAHSGVPRKLSQPEAHACVRYRFPTTGKLQPWDLATGKQAPPELRTALVCNNMEALRGAAEAGFGIGYMPDFLVRDALAAGTLATVLDEACEAPGQFSILWPSSRHLTPRLRVFVDFVCERLFKTV